MVSDSFLGFAAHAHTKNELEMDEEKERELRRKNSPQEAKKLTELILRKIEKDVKKSSCGLEDVKLLLLYSSYRGEPEEKDNLICESILRTVEDRFKGHIAHCGLRLIGHTTAGELENEDLLLKEVSGIGYNGLSIMAFVSSLPIGIGRTLGLRTERGAAEQGREMVRDAWVDFCQQTSSREFIQKSKTLHVLAQGMTVEGPGYEHFLSEGIANFMGTTREARIVNVVGGNTGDGLLATVFHQFYGSIGERTHFKVLEKEAVCALIPNLSEPSIGLNVDICKRIGNPHTFHFDLEKEPRFTYVKWIDGEDPCREFARAIYENEADVAMEKGSLVIAEQDLLDAIHQLTFLGLHPTIAQYGFAFDFGGYSIFSAIRAEGQELKITPPVKSIVPEIPGYVVVGDVEKIQKGARNVSNMLRVDRGFSREDATIIVSCLSRRQLELRAGCKSGTEAEVLKETMASTQLIGFLAYGELAFTYLLQEPYVWYGTCWGLTFHSSAPVREDIERGKSRLIHVEERQAVAEFKPNDHVATGHVDLDKLLYGGIPLDYAVVLTSPSCDERDLLIKSFLRTGVKNREVTFYVTINASLARALSEKSMSNLQIFVCNPEAEAIIKSSSSVHSLKGVENLTDISIALTSAIRQLEPALEGPKRICLELVSDVLLQHHAVETRRWLTALMTKLKSEDFTTLAIIDPQAHPSEELHAILGLFDGEINIREKETEKGLERYLRVKKMSNQKYLEDEVLLKKEI
jgi:KaiC/GvpD/RAD55 family RecA-like ATPase